MNFIIRRLLKAYIDPPSGNTHPPNNPPNDLFDKLQDNLNRIQTEFGGSTDIVIREFRIHSLNGAKAALVYLEGLVDQQLISESLMESLLQFPKGDVSIPAILPEQNPVTYIKEFVLAIGKTSDITNFDSLYQAVLSGFTTLLIDGCNQAISAATLGGKDRGVTESSREIVIRGPQESFSESLRTNTALIRRKIRDRNLRLETKQIGRVTKTDVAIMYVNGIVNEKVVGEVRSRLNQIDTDSILESGYIEEWIQDETFTPFPTMFYSERPDVIAGELLEGKVAILIDGTPMVLIVPALFVSFINSAEDYYQRANISSALRILRYFGIFISFLAPSLYIAITTFHQEMLPTDLLINLADQHAGVPFPAFIEALMMEITFEILREAGLRMPKAIGQTISIVGTLVLGQAAVAAGIVSPAMVIIVSITAISSFLFPSYNMAIAFRLLRFPMMGLAASFGIFGIFVGVVAILFHLCTLRSFGVPYMSPFAPLTVSDLKDTIFRLPHWMLVTRPRSISQKNVIRSKPSQPEK
ncbi:spore germination protein [Paenibacillus montanisoli]|uniref:Spore germination protein n=1 Tax=Paenibacillus montanisoli TaxID=2081970 RepID=A0A328U564_9BACL|nr:spore germination protein [Paenibacillus montanisoli]RAP76551.1 spore germination protein [Paenibacillus montanisoli]